MPLALAAGPIPAAVKADTVTWYEVLAWRLGIVTKVDVTLTVPNSFPDCNLHITW